MTDEITLTKRELNLKRGARLKKLRSMGMLSSAQLAEKTGFSRVTLSYWENATKMGLSEKGARKVLTVIQNSGVKCDFDWLWYGKGPEPRFINHETDEFYASPHQKMTQHIIPSIEREIELFLEVNEDTVILKVKNNDFLPFFKFNDIIGGIWQPLNSSLCDQFCIVTIDSINYLRWVKKSLSLASTFHLSFSPSANHHQKLAINEKEIQHIAPVLRVWRY